ncbi:MAG: 3-demethylubiquinone-9 3-O-methyltransferase [Alteromonadales bacterium]|nr:3-demethylubiquinone-9 3-O-methyltransferase [Alteromonadales bacterium]
MKNDLEQYNKNGKLWWDRKGPFYVLKSMNEKRFQFFDKFITSWKDVKVLDVGCGGGFTSEFMAKKGALVSGIDISEVSINTATEHAKESNLDIDYRSGTAVNLPYDNDSFDAIVCVDVLEHIDDITKAIAEIKRVLKPGGTFLFDTINKTFKSKFIMIWLLENIKKEIPKGTHDWSMFIPPKQMIAYLEKENFKNIELTGFDVKGIDSKDKKIIAEINDNLSVMYLGKAVLTV